jgi:hypothetical protein
MPRPARRDRRTAKRQSCRYRRESPQTRVTGSGPPSGSIPGSPSCIGLFGWEDRASPTPPKREVADLELAGRASQRVREPSGSRLARGVRYLPHLVKVSTDRLTEQSTRTAMASPVGRVRSDSLACAVRVRLSPKVFFDSAAFALLDDRKILTTEPKLEPPALPSPHQHPTRTLSGRQDLNLRPPGPQPGALPDCATPRGAHRFYGQSPRGTSPTRSGPRRQLGA